MRPVIITKALTAASANSIALSQSVGAGGGAVALNGAAASGGVATLDTQRRIIITSGGNDSGITATITGANGTGTLRSEVLALTNGGVAASVQDYLTITKITLSGATGTTITVGTNTTGSTDWIMPNFHLTPFELNQYVELSGSVTWSLEGTQSNYWDPTPNTGSGATTPQPTVVEIIQASTVGMQNVLTAPVRGYRYTITAGTGTLSAQNLQSGIANY